jgi:hypothetical protein
MYLHSVSILPVMGRMVDKNSENPDGWSLRPGLTSVLTVIVVTLGCQILGALNLLLIPLTLLGFVVGTVIVVVLAVVLVSQKRPRRGASIFLVLLLPLILWRPINWITDVIHIGLTVNLGIGQLGVARADGDDFTVYDWSIGLVTNPSTFLIHDVTDEIALPLAQHTHPANSEAGFGENCAGHVSRVLKHYYICTIE